MRKSSSIFVLGLILISVVTATFQNCAPYSGGAIQSPFRSAASAPSLMPSSAPTVSFSAVQAIRGQAPITVLLKLDKVDKPYALTWQIIGSGGDFSPAEGSVAISAGATQASLSFSSIAAPGSGNKSYVLQVTEASAGKFSGSNPVLITDTTPPPSIAAGYWSACAAINKTAKCWGDNSKGELGTGDMTSQLLPTDIAGPSVPLTQVSVGQFTACGIADGALYCWGDNSGGLIGDGTTTSRAAPAAVPSLSSGVQQVSVGPVHACAIMNGGAYCWGNNKRGQLGNGVFSDTSQLAPSPVPGANSGVTWISAGYYTTCAVQNGVGKCWGWGEYGQLGNGANNDTATPQTVSGAAAGVTRISAGGYHACAIVNGAPKCWGSNFYGELGDGTQTDRNVAASVTNLPGAKEIATGREHSCAISTSGGVWCWGYNDKYTVGDGTTVNRKSPGQVVNLTTGAQAISAGALGDFTCAIVNNNFVCWGLGDHGQRGTGSTTNGPPGTP